MALLLLTLLTVVATWAFAEATPAMPAIVRVLSEGMLKRKLTKSVMRIVGRSLDNTKVILGKLEDEAVRSQECESRALKSQVPRGGYVLCEKSIHARCNS